MLPVGWFPLDGNKAMYYFNIVHNSFVCPADTGIQAQSLFVSDLGQHFETSQFSFEPHTKGATNGNDLILALATLGYGHILLLCCVIDHPALPCLKIVLSA